jgi:PilZ domain
MHDDPKGSERRRHVRRPFACAVSCLPTEGEGAGQWWDAAVTDISRGGVRVLSDRWFESRDILRIRLGRDGDSTAIVVIVRVVRVHSCPDGKWLIGCQFAPELCEEELQAILDKKQEIHENVN